jgi:hypothetical protein
MLDAPFPNLRSEHRSEPVPPEPHRLVADIDAALEQNVVALGSKQSDVVRCPGNGLIRIAPAEHLRIDRHRSERQAVIRLSRRVQEEPWILKTCPPPR